MLTAIVISALAGALLGGGATFALTRDKPSDADTVAEVATVVDAVVAEDVTDAETRGGVVEGTPVELLAQAVIDAGDVPIIAASYGYAQCVTASQGKQEGSAAYGCGKRGERLDAAVDALDARMQIEAATARDMAASELAAAEAMRADAWAREAAAACPEPAPE